MLSTLRITTLANLPLWRKASDRLFVDTFTRRVACVRCDTLVRLTDRYRIVDERRRSVNVPTRLRALCGAVVRYSDGGKPRARRT
jgi:hypothetical protein